MTFIQVKLHLQIDGHLQDSVILCGMRMRREVSRSTDHRAQGFPVYQEVLSISISRAKLRVEQNSAEAATLLAEASSEREQVGYKISFLGPRLRERLPDRRDRSGQCCYHDNSVSVHE